MAMRSFAIGLMAFILILAATLLWRSGRPPTASKPPSATQEDLAKLEERLRGEIASEGFHRAQAGTLLAPSEPRPSSSVAGRVAPALDQPPPRMTEDEKAFARQQAIDKTAHRLDEYMEREVPDSVWSFRMRQDIAAAFSRIEGQTLSTAECRAKLCRVVVASASPFDQKSLARKILDHPPFDGEVFFKYDTESTPPRTSLYVGREGSSLLALGAATE